jgi:Domain of unknown function (DUF5753)
VVRNFQPGIIPGLLQTAEYARQIMALAGIGLHGGLAAAVAARLGRQQALHDPDRSFEFLLTEAALRYRPAPLQALTAQPGGRRDASTNQTLTAQLDHLAAAVTLETNSFGLIPADAEMHAITRCGFILYEDRTGGQPPLAAVEAPHASLYASDPADVAPYREQLDRLPCAAVVVEDRYSQVFKLARVRPAVVADGLAELQVRWPNVPIVFCEARALAEEWTCRFLAAAHAWAATEAAAIERLTPLAASAAATELAAAPGLPEPSAAEVRAWAGATGRAVPGRGKLRPEIWAAWRTVHRG